MEIDQKSLAWISQQSVAKQRMAEGVGEPGIVRIEQVADKSGLRILEGMMRGELPYPSMNQTMNMTLLEVGDGRVVFQGIPLLEHYNPLGSVHGGWFATLLDSALGCAVQTMLPAGRSYATADFSMDIVRPASHNTGPLRAVGTVIHVGRQIATAEAHVEDEEGTLYAQAITTCFVFDVPVA